jgi:hypothetical protein
VILIEIDSGAKPSIKEVPELRTPIQALENASYANTCAANRWYRHRLNELLKPSSDPTEALKRIAEGKTNPLAYGYMAWLPFQCNHVGNEDVPTTWTLAPDEKAKILATFSCEYIQWSEMEVNGVFREWLSAWEHQGEGGSVGQGCAPERIPEVPACWESKEEAQQKRREELSAIER